MANEQNLRPSEYKLSQEEAKKGGIASGEARRRKRDIRLALEALLEKDYADKSGKSLSGAEAIALKQIEKALRGDTKAFEVVRDTVGQKPIDRIEVATINDTTRAEMEEYFGRAGRDKEPAKE